MVAICAASPEFASKLILHIIFCLGSLVEPFDTVLPKRSFLRCFIQQVQRARRAYNVKYGLSELDSKEFLDDLDEAPAKPAAVEDSPDAGEASGEAADEASGEEPDESSGPGRLMT